MKFKKYLEKYNELISEIEKLEKSVKANKTESLNEVLDTRLRYLYEEKSKLENTELLSESELEKERCWEGRD